MATAKKKNGEEQETVYDFSDLSIEDGLKELDDITAKMQDPALPLEETFALYQKGTALLSYVTGKVESVEEKVRILKGDGSTAPFTPPRGSGSDGNGYGGDGHGVYGDDELV